MRPSGVSGDSSDGSGDSSGNPGGSDNAKTKGLSINYTDNFAAHTQTAVINGRISYLLLGLLCRPNNEGDISTLNLGFGIAPFVSSNGTWNEPLTSQVQGTTIAGKTITVTTHKISTSALRFGSDFMISYDKEGDHVDRNYFYISPFYQTDYRGMANIDGVTLAYEPVVRALFMDTAPPPSTGDLFSFFWQFRAEGEFTDVSNPGLTQFVKGGHSLIGELVRLHLDLFPITWGEQDPSWYEGRISFIGTQQFFWDAATAHTAAYYSAQLQYKLGACKVDKTKPDPTCAIDGSSAIAFEYDWGRDKDTFVKTDQFLVKLSYSY